MTNSANFLPRLLSDGSSIVGIRSATASSNRRSRNHRGQASAVLPDEDAFGQSLLAILGGATVVSVGYALAQLWHVVGGDTLNHMVRTFLG